MLWLFLLVDCCITRSGLPRLTALAYDVFGSLFSIMLTGEHFSSFNLNSIWFRMSCLIVLIPPSSYCILFRIIDALWLNCPSLFPRLPSCRCTLGVDVRIGSVELTVTGAGMGSREDTFLILSPWLVIFSAINKSFGCVNEWDTRSGSLYTSRTVCAVPESVCVSGSQVLLIPISSVSFIGATPGATSQLSASRETTLQFDALSTSFVMVSHICSSCRERRSVRSPWLIRTRFWVPTNFFR